MYSIVVGIISIIMLILTIYIGIIGVIDESMDTISRIDIETSPPSSEYYNAYQWIKWASDYDIKRAFYKKENSLSSTLSDFEYEFRIIFTDSINPPLRANMWDTTGPELKRHILPMDQLKLFHRPYYEILTNPGAISRDFLKRRLQLNQLDKKEYEYLFDFMTKNHALQNTCKAWSPFLELYAQERNDSTALNCCQDILAFRPDS